MSTYPVQVEFSQPHPKQFQRLHILFRVLFLIALSAVVHVGGGVMSIFYFALPGVTAVLLSQHGAGAFLKSDSLWLIKALHWYTAFGAYLFLLTDTLPTKAPTEIVRIEVQPEGSPSIGSALSRLLYSLPSFLALGLLSIFGGIVWLIAALSILLKENYPPALYRFLQGILSWQVRLLPYHASLIEQYPPFSLDLPPQPPTQDTQ